MQGAAMRALGLVSLLSLACALPPQRAPVVPVPLPLPAAVEAPALLVRGATVMTAAGSSLKAADVLVRGERIVSVGPRLAVPETATIIDARGKWVTPGLIDPHSHLGVYAVPMVSAHADGNEASSPFTPEVRASEGFWPQDPAIERALAGGVTTIHVLPGSANLVGGQGATLRLVPALSAEQMRLPGSPASLKMACGENPKRMHGEIRKSKPKTRMGEVAMLRARLAQASAYAPEAGKAPDYGKSAIAAALRGESLIQNHCYRADEMLLWLALFAEFGAKPRAFHHAVEAYKIADQLAAADVGAVVWADWWGIKMELLDAVFANAALLDRAGVRVALHSDSPFDVQRLNQQAAFALAAGRRAGIDVDQEAALRWITANPAWVLGIDDQVGTLEPGKRADLVIWSHDPFSVYALVERVMIDGNTVFERASRHVPRSDFELGREGPR
jgi:imidazolonepropionase-like amidohydrolase